MDSIKPMTFMCEVQPTLHEVRPNNLPSTRFSRTHLIKRPLKCTVNRITLKKMRCEKEEESYFLVCALAFLQVMEILHRCYTCKGVIECGRGMQARGMGQGHGGKNCFRPLLLVGTCLSLSCLGFPFPLSPSPFPLSLFPFPVPLLSCRVCLAPSSASLHSCPVSLAPSTAFLTPLLYLLPPSPLFWAPSPVLLPHSPAPFPSLLGPFPCPLSSFTLAPSRDSLIPSIPFQNSVFSNASAVAGRRHG